MLFDPFKKKLQGNLDDTHSESSDPPVAITPEDGMPLSLPGATFDLATSGSLSANLRPASGGLMQAIGTGASVPTGAGSSPTTTFASTGGPVTATSYPAWVATLSTASIAADFQAADVNGVVGATGLSTLLAHLASSLATSHSTLTSAQFADLRTIATNLTNGVSTSANLVYSMSALAFGNAMNATWTGGGASSVALGNLGVGSSSTVLSELAGKWFGGTDRPSSTVSMQGAGTFSISYSAVNKALFGASGPSAADVNQGYLGDCYVLASAAEIASQNASLISSMFTVNDNGTCSVRFYENGSATYVTVDTQLANGGSIFNRGSNAWASLLEKAYAQLEVGGVWTGNSVNYGNSYSTIGNGGDPSTALEVLTGASAVTTYYASGGSWNSYTLNQASRVTSNQAGLSTSTLQQMLITALNGHNDLVLCSNTNATDSAGRTTLVAGHAMSITGFDTATGKFQIRNPWGASYGQSWDTTFEVDLSTLYAAGDYISVDNAGSNAAGKAAAPVLSTQTATQTWRLGSSVNFALPATTFRDPNGEALTYRATLASGASLPTWLSFNAATATFSGLVPLSAANVSIKVTATNTDGLSASEIFTAQTPALAPVLKTVTDTLSFVAGKTSTFTLPGTSFVDPQGETLTLSARQASGAALPSWLTFNAATGTLTGNPPAGSTALKIVVTATNTSGLSASESISLLTPKPAAPLVTAPTAAQQVARGAMVSFQLAANTFTDPNGESMTYSARQSNNAALPSWLTFNAATRTFQGRAPTTTGTYGLTVTATDAGGASASESFLLSVSAAAASLVQSASGLVSSSALASLSAAGFQGSGQTTLATPLH